MEGTVTKSVQITTKLVLAAEASPKLDSLMRDRARRAAFVALGTLAVYTVLTLRRFLENRSFLTFLLVIAGSAAFVSLVSVVCAAWTAKLVVRLTLKLTKATFTPPSSPGN